MNKLHHTISECAMASHRLSRLFALSCVTALSLAALDPASAEAGRRHRHAVSSESASHHRSHRKLHGGRPRPELKLVHREHHRSRHHHGAGGHHAGDAAMSLQQAAFAAGPRYYLTVGFGAKDSQSQHMQLFREAMQKELAALPGVTLSLADEGSQEEQLKQRQLHGFIIDGSVQMESNTWAGGQQIACKVQAIVSTWPAQTMQMISAEGAALETGSTPAAETTGQRDCLIASVSAVRDDIQKFLGSLR